MRSEQLYINSKLKAEQIGFKPEASKTTFQTIYEYSQFQNMDTNSPCFINLVGRYQLNSDVVLNRHLNISYDLIWVYDGKLTISTESVKKNVSKNNVILIKTTGTYKISVPEKLTVSTFLLLSHYGKISEEYSRLISNDTVSIFEIHNKDIFTGLLDDIVELMHFPFYHNPMLSANKLTKIFTELYSSILNSQDTNQEYTYPNWLHQCLVYIDKNYAKKITVSQIAEISFMSCSHFTKLFKQYTKISPYDYLIQVRLSNAKMLLDNKDYSINYISRLVGYKSVNHFIAHFKHKYGHSPNVYRSN